MSKLSYKISYYILYALIAITVVILVMFYAVGWDNMIGTYHAPAHTDALLYLMYGMLGICVLATIIAAVVQFVTALIDSPKNAIKSLLGLVLLVVLLVVSYSMGSTDTVMTGDGPYTDQFWLKISDMMIYSIYVLLAGTILSMLFSAVMKRIG